MSEDITKKLKKDFKSWLKTYLSNSEKSLNTPNENQILNAMTLYCKDITTKNEEYSKLDKQQQVVIDNSLKDYVKTYGIQQYKSSLVNHNRLINNSQPTEITDEFKKENKEKINNIQDFVKKEYKDLLKKIKDTKNAPNEEQLTNYLNTKVLTQVNEITNPEVKQYVLNYGYNTICKYVNNYKNDLGSIRINDLFPWNEEQSPNDQKKVKDKTSDNEKYSSVKATIDSNNSFSGCDMVCTINFKTPNGYVLEPVVIGSLQTLTYSIHQEKKPVNVIGKMNACDYVFGPRTIAGSLVFAVLNKHWAIDIIEKYAEQGKIGDSHFLIDEIPPFDITISFANEYGKSARMAIYGVRIVDEGMVMSINDVYTENTYQYVATNIDYLADIASSNSNALFAVTPKKLGNKISFETNSDKFKDTTKNTEKSENNYGIHIPEKITDVTEKTDTDSRLSDIDKKRNTLKEEAKSKYDNGEIATEKEYQSIINTIDSIFNKFVSEAMQNNNGK